jgi:hypothetical protein
MEKFIALYKSEFRIPGSLVNIFRKRLNKTAGEFILRCIVTDCAIYRSMNLNFANGLHPLESLLVFSNFLENNDFTIKILTLECRHQAYVKFFPADRPVSVEEYHVKVKDNGVEEWIDMGEYFNTLCGEYYAPIVLIPG